MYYGQPLFTGEYISDHFDYKKRELLNQAQHLIEDNNSEMTEDQLANKIISHASMKPLAIDFDDVDKAITPAKIFVRDYERSVEIDGVQVVFTYPFKGDSCLFRIQPTTKSSPLHGIVSNGSVSIGVKCHNDIEEIRREMKAQNGLLRKYVEWQRADIERYNESLRNYVSDVVREKQKYVDGIKRLKDQL
ncbi:protein of unknown function [Candidatus Filomicrobium marinum]|uniref:Uncharacterized protein n=1 Tax=Candidatus Filomicrobium marinum TaxID=1608628 RepID=A0A0D6JCS5_9HYPH|nr:hypothetical protein [Candidatus Filomicrobium marinum]CFX12061.1 protein of unknown function [Candidatus Filomicrobium marinum]CPR17385.1 protein of unknown function [Candidatus Filomicrobium marinum]